MAPLTLSGVSDGRHWCYPPLLSLACRGTSFHTNRISLKPRPWPSQDIVITNIVCCKAHKRVVEGGGRMFPNSRAIVWQQSGLCRWVGGLKGRLIRAQTTRSKSISCKGQPRPNPNPLRRFGRATSVQTIKSGMKPSFIMSRSTNIIRTR